MKTKQLLLTAVLLASTLFSFGQELKMFKENGKWGYKDSIGNVVVAAKYDYINSFSEGLAKVELNGKYGYINKEGKEVIAIKYDNGGNFNDGLVSVE